MLDHYKELGGLVLLGAVIGLGQLLASGERITVRLAIGRALCSGGLGGAASSALVVWPDLPPAALLGIACAIASLGTSLIESIFARMAGAR